MTVKGLKYDSNIFSSTKQIYTYINITRKMVPIMGRASS